MKIAVDFDGTCVTHSFPAVGQEIGANEVLLELTKKGHKLILFTMRSDNVKTGQMYLTDAVNWFKKWNIPLYGIQADPQQKAWTTSPKCYAEIYIDDVALGAPLIYNPDMSDRPFIDWTLAKDFLVKKGAL
jgi:hypothetical protein